MVKLNLGAGKDPKKKGWSNIDRIKAGNIDIVHDLNQIPYPFKDNSIDEIYSRMLLEHLEIPIWKFMGEIHRILKPKGIITTIVPHYSGMYAFYEEHHKFFTYFALSLNNTLETNWTNYFIELERDLSFERAWYNPLNPFMEWFANKYPYCYENTFLRALFPAYELKVVLRKKED